MKKIIVICIIAHFSNILATEAILCSSFIISNTTKLSCGKYGKMTFNELYNDGWHYAGDISGISNSFMLVFERTSMANSNKKSTKRPLQLH